MTEIVAVTFTEKAAGELKLRLREALEHERARRRPTRRRARCGSSRRSRRSRRRTSTRFTASAPSCCASGRSRRASIRCSRCSTEPQADRLYARAFRALAAGGARAIRRRVCGARCAGRARRRSAAATATVRSIGCAAPGARWPSGATSRRPGAGRRSIATPRSIASSTALHRLADLTARAVVAARQPVHRHRRRAPPEPADRAGAVVRPARLRRLGGAARRSRARPRLLADPQGQRLQVRQGRDARPTCSPRATRCSPTCSSSSEDADADLAACLQQELAGATARYQALKAAAGALDFADLLARARDLIANERRRPAASAAASSRASSSTSSRTPIRSRRRSCCCWRPTIRTSADCDRRAPGAGQAVHRRRSEAGDLPVPRHRCRRPTGASAGSSSAAAAGVLQLTTSYRSVPAIQRFVNAAFAQEMTGERRDAAGRLRAAVAAPRRRRLAAGHRRAAGAEAVRGARTAEGVGEGHRGVAAGRRRRVHRLARRRDATAGRSPSAAPTAPSTGCRCSRGTSPCCSAASSASARTSRGRTSTRSRRAASRICSSAARRSTAARKSRRSARRWPRSSGPTTSCRCSRRSKDRSSRSTMSTCSSSGIGSARFHPFRVPQELGGNSGQDLALTGEPTAHLMPIADALRLLQQLHRRPQLPAGRRHDRPAARRDARARRLHPAAGRRAGAGQRAARRRARAAVRSRRRHFVPRLHRRAAGRRRVRGGRSADPRGEQRRRAADDGAQGQGPRVPGRHPRRPDLPAQPRRREPLPRSRDAACAR